MIGIYCIVNTITGDRYIGSSINILKRKGDHLRELNRDKHHSDYLQRAWNKYSEDAFEFLTLKECLKEDLLILEQQYIDFENPKYNMCRTAGNILGLKRSKEFCEKMRIINTGIKRGPRSEETKNKIRNTMKSNININRKSVHMVDKNTNVILNTFTSACEASEFIRGNSKYNYGIISVCKGYKKSAFGYKWRYNNDI